MKDREVAAGQGDVGDDDDDGADGDYDNKNKPKHEVDDDLDKIDVDKDNDADNAVVDGLAVGQADDDDGDADEPLNTNDDRDKDRDIDKDADYDADDKMHDTNANAAKAADQKPQADLKPAGGSSSGSVSRMLPAVGAKAGRSSGAQLTRPTPGGTLFSWGLKEWRLARNKGDNSVPEPALPELVVTSVAASRHSAISASDGSVWTMGHNDSRGGGGHGSPPLDASGQLGRGGDLRPARVEGELVGKFVVQAIAGRYHTMAVTDDGAVYTWGLNDWGQLGRAAQGAKSAEDPGECFAGPSCHSGTPKRITELAHVKIVGAAAGRYVSMALDSEGRLYTWGHDGCSNDGKLPPRDQAYKPRLVKGALEGKPVVAFDAGYVFWVAATTDGEVYTCNTQDDGYAGTLSSKRDWNDAGELGRTGDPLRPGRVMGVLADKKVMAVAAGREHAVVADADGKVFTWGGRDLLAGRSGNMKEPGQALGDLVGDKVLFVAAGEYYSGAASAKMVYGWGSNDYLCTGVGRGNPVQELKGGRDRGNVMRPAKARGAIGQGGWEVQALVGGFQHVLAIAINSTAGAYESRVPRGLVAGEEELQKELADDDVTAEAANTAVEAGQKQGIKAAAGRKEPGPEPRGEPRQEAKAAAAEAGLAAAAGAGLAAADTAVAYTYQEPAAATDSRLSYLAPQIHAPKYNVSEYIHRYRRSDRINLIKAESADVFEVLPPGFLKQYQNPCWHSSNGTLRCIPYFHIMGVSKCGTTDLYHRLSKHPQMFESANKGPHWWDECPYPAKGACTAPPNGDFDGYVNLFAGAAQRIAKEDPLGITGEASSNTFTAAMGVFLRGASWDRNTTVTMPELLREASPFLRLITIFRNPVDRYFSAFYYYRWWLKDQPVPGPKDFHETAVKEIGQWRACVEQHGQKYCVRHYNPQQLVKGMYSEFMHDWLSHWPRDQLLFLRNEDYAGAQRQHMEAVFDFLQMRRPTEQQWASIMAMKTRNKNSDKYEPMLPETRRLLEDFYRPFNEKLARILEDERYLWKKAD